MTKTRHVALALIAGCAATGALLLTAPTAVAEPPPGGECQQQDAPPPEGEQQQCQDQGQGIPELPDLPQDQGDQDDQQNRLSDTNCWMYPEGPEWFPPGTAPRPVMAGTQVWPCYHVLGLQPTIPGT